jgi:sn-glycerol 3-phosphate transport system permease protein
MSDLGGDGGAVSERQRSVGAAVGAHGGDIDIAEAAAIAEQAPLPRAGRSKRAQRARQAALGYLLLLPAFVIFAVFIFYPFAKNFELALYRTNPVNPNLRTYVGFDQISDVLQSDYLLSSLWTTVVFAVLTVPAGVLLGLALAVAAHQRLRGIAIYRTLFSSTVATSVAVAAVIFGTLFNPVIGWLPWLGFDPQPPLLEDPTWALPAVAILTVWQNIGFAFIVMSAGLQAVPDEILEAAQIDGARAWRRFWRVTVPMLSPTLFFATVVGTIIAFQTFGQIHLLTKGGPGESTNVLAYAVYNSLNIRNDSGEAAVLAIALFFVTLTITGFQLRVLERRVHYA